MFKISLYYNKKKRIIACERIYESKQIERYQCTIKDRFIIVENNRPAERLKNKNSHKFKWKVYKTSNAVNVEKINEFNEFCLRLFEALESYIENIVEGGFELKEEHKHNKKGENRIQ